MITHRRCSKKIAMKSFVRLSVFFACLLLARTTLGAGDAAGPPAARSGDEVIRVVYHADFADPRRFSAMLTNVYNMVTTYLLKVE